MYVVLTTLLPDNPQISDWLGIGDTLAEPWRDRRSPRLRRRRSSPGSFFQLREEARRGPRRGCRDRVGPTTTGPTRTRRRAGPAGARRARQTGAAPTAGPRRRRRAVRSRDRRAGPTACSRALASARPSPQQDGLPTRRARLGRPAPRGRQPGWPVVIPAWQPERDAGSLGPVGVAQGPPGRPPVRADRSRELDRERGGRLDRLDVWVLALLAISLLTVRMWRLDEPYQMHFDEVYHPRTATEFLQDWRYGLPHEHLRVDASRTSPSTRWRSGIVALGEDQVRRHERARGRRARRGDRAAPGRRPRCHQGSRATGCGSPPAARSGPTTSPPASSRAPSSLPGRRGPRRTTSSSHRLYVGTRGGEIRVDRHRRSSTPIRGAAGAAVPSRGPIIDARAARSAAVPDPRRRAAWPSRSQPDVGAEDPDLPRRARRASTPSARHCELGSARAVRGVDPGRRHARRPDLVGHRGRRGGHRRRPRRDRPTTHRTSAGRSTASSAISDIHDDPIYVTVDDRRGPARSRWSSPRAARSPRLDETFTLPGRRRRPGVLRPGRADGPRRGLGARRRRRATGATDGLRDRAARQRRLRRRRPALPPDRDRPGRATRSTRRRIGSSSSPSTRAAGQRRSRSGATRSPGALPGVIAGVLMALFLYVLARLLFRRRTVAVIVGPGRAASTGCCSSRAGSG